MVQIDLSRVAITEANDQIRALAADGQDVEIVNPDARHNIGVGLVIVDHHLDEVRVVEGRRGALEGGVVEVPLR